MSIVGGGNDILRPRADIDSLAVQLEEAVMRIRATGADVLLATPTDPREAPVLKHVRGRNATYAAHVWTIARRHGCAVVDLWGNEALRDWRMWAEARIHLTSRGHDRVARSALAALGHGDINGDWSVPLPDKPWQTTRQPSALPHRGTLKQAIEAQWTTLCSPGLKSRRGSISTRAAGPSCFSC